MTTLLLIRITLLEQRALIPIVWLILQTLRVLVVVPLTNRSLEPLLKTLLRIETLAVITTKTLC